jgi:hypothetical protein
MASAWVKSFQGAKQNPRLSALIGIPLTAGGFRRSSDLGAGRAKPRQPDRFRIEKPFFDS